VWLVRDATGEADRLPPSGRAMEVLDVSVGERSSEIGVQHLSLLSSTTTLHPVPTEVAAPSIVCVGRLVRVGLQSELEFACRGF
jgi:hypothetical protein